jgi:hypothetical protein
MEYIYVDKNNIGKVELLESKLMNELEILNLTILIMR